MADRIKGITIELNGDATGLDKALKGVNSEIKDTEKELKDVNRLLKLDPGNTELLAQKQKLLTKEIGDTQDKLKTLKNAATDAKKALDNGEITQKQYDALQREIIETETKLKGLETQAQKTGDELKQSGEKGEKAFNSEKLLNGLKNFAAGAGVAIAAVGAAVTKLGKEFVNAAKETADYGNNIDKMSQKLGMSAEAYQKWDYIMGQNGASIDGLKGSMKKLATEAANNAAEFQKLGISQEEVATLSQEELFDRTIAGLQAMGEGTERTATATKLLGKGAVELAPLLNQSAEATAELAQKAQDYGFIISDEAVKASAAFQDSLDTLSKTAEGLKNRLMAEFLPALTEVTDGLALLFTGDMSGLDSINSGITDLVNKVAEVLPQFLEIGGSIIETIALGLVNNLEKIGEAAVSVVMELIQFISDHLNDVISIAIQLVNTLALGILGALPKLISSLAAQLPSIISTVISALLDAFPLILDAAFTMFNALIDAIPMIIEALLQNLPNIIKTIIDFLIKNLPLIIKGAIEMFMGLIQAIPQILIALAQNLPKIITEIISFLIKNIPLIIKGAIEMFMGLIKAIPQIIIELVKSLPTIIKSIVSGLIEGIPELIKAGGELLSGLFSGLINPSKIWESVKKLFSGIVDGLKSLFGIHSPSKVMENLIGKNLALGIAEGFDDNMLDVNEKMAKAVKFPSMIAESAQNVNLTQSVNMASNPGLTNMLGQYLPYLANKQTIVLDTGVLVGETAPMYNKALGKMTRQGA